MAIAQSLLQIAEEEAQKQNCNRITQIKVKYGALTGIMPEALSLCVEALTRGTIHENVELIMELSPAKLRCPFCNETFGGNGENVLWQPCPGCGEGFGHIVEQGKELLLTHLEAERFEAGK